MKKRLTALLIALALLLPSTAPARATVIVCHPGDIIDCIFVLAEGSDKPDGIMGRLTYDKDIFSLFSADNVIGQDGVFIFNGQPLTIPFQVSKYAPDGTFSIGIQITEAVDADGRPYGNVQIEPVQVQIGSVGTPAPEPMHEPDSAAKKPLTATALGFMGPVTVLATFTADGRVETLSVSKAEFQETEGMGGRALDPMNLTGFIGQQMPLAAERIDALTGSTYTKSAIVNAVNTAYAAGTPYNSGIASANGEGMFGTVTVYVTFTADGRVNSISIDEETFQKTPGIGGEYLKPGALSCFIGRQTPVNAEEVDGITGATETKNAIVSAINAAYAGITSKENTYSASADGMGGPVTVYVSFTADGRVETLSIDEETFQETPGIGGKYLEPDALSCFIGQQAPIDPDQIDGITGATVTKYAIVNAINAAFTEAGLAP